jgi:hypothetical protein
MAGTRFSFGQRKYEFVLRAIIFVFHASIHSPGDSSHPVNELVDETIKNYPLAQMNQAKQRYTALSDEKELKFGWVR